MHAIFVFGYLLVQCCHGGRRTLTFFDALGAGDAAVSIDAAAHIDAAASMNTKASGYATATDKSKCCYCASPQGKDVVEGICHRNTQRILRSWTGTKTAGQTCESSCAEFGRELLVKVRNPCSEKPPWKALAAKVKAMKKIDTDALIIPSCESLPIPIEVSVFCLCKAPGTPLKAPGTPLKEQVCVGDTLQHSGKTCAEVCEAFGRMSTGEFRYENKVERQDVAAGFKRCDMTKPLATDVVLWSHSFSDVFNVDSWVDSHSSIIALNPTVLQLLRDLTPALNVDMDDPFLSDIWHAEDVFSLAYTILSQVEAWTRRVLQSFVNVCLLAGASQEVRALLTIVAQVQVASSSVLQPLSAPFSLFSYIMLPYHYYRKFTLEALTFQQSLEFRTNCLMNQLRGDGWARERLRLKPSIQTACPGNVSDDLTALALESRDALDQALGMASNLARCLSVAQHFTVGHRESRKVRYQKKECIRIIRPSLFDVPGGLLTQLSMRAEFWKVFIESLFVDDDLQLGYITSMFSSLAKTSLISISQSIKKAFNTCPGHGPCPAACAAAALGLAQSKDVFLAIARTIRLWPRTGARSHWRMPWLEPLGMYGGSKSMTSLYPCKAVFKAAPADGSGYMCPSPGQIIPIGTQQHAVCSKAFQSQKIWSDV